MSETQTSLADLQFVPPGLERLPEVFQLYERAFGTAIDPALWEWKFGQGRGLGVLALKADQVIAHYGGIVRQVLFDGNSGQALMPADVMVAPEHRGVLTRNGVMQRTARFLFERNLGEGRACRLAVGFPTRRHRLLGEKLGLYEDGGALRELVWPVASQRRWSELGLRVQVLDGIGQMEWCAAAWSMMREDLAHHVVGVRDAQWLAHRYGRHPFKRYQVLGVAGGFGAFKLGVAVLHEAEGEAECLDLMTTRSRMPLLIRALQGWMRERHLTVLRMWVNEPFVAGLLTRDTQVLDRDMRMTVTTGARSRAYAQRWWVSAGDTDFR